MATSNHNTRTLSPVSSQPDTHFYRPQTHRGDTISSLMQLVEEIIPSARPLMSVADLRILLRVNLRFELPCESCEGAGSVVAGAFTDQANERCEECRGKGFTKLNPDPICANCGQPESDHAAHGDWCPAENEDQIFSSTRKFRQKESA